MRLATDRMSGELVRLQRENPRGYGFLRRYWEAAKRGLDETDRNYATVKQIYDNVPDPDFDTRTLGQTLTILTTLDVISVHTQRSNATIYDLTTYRPARLAEVGRLLDVQ